MCWIKYFLRSSAIVFLLGSCSDDNLLDNPDSHPQGSEVIGYGLSPVVSRSTKRNEAPTKTTALHAISKENDSLWIYMSEIPTEQFSSLITRGIAQETAKINSFDVTCIRTVNGTMSDTYFSSETYTGTAGADTWVNENGNIYYWWPENASFDFYALSPAKAKITGSMAEDFTFTVENSVKDQIDLCATKVENATPNQKVRLSFHHLLSRIIFKVPEETELATGKIISIELSNIVSTGSYSHSTGKWTLSTNDTFTYKLTPEAAYASGADLTGHDLQLFLMPQSLSEKSILTLTFQPTRNGENSGGVKTYTKQLTGINWQAGLTYLFNVRISPQGFFEFTQDSPIQDANYVMHTNTIQPLEDVGSSSWRVEARTSDNAGVTIQKEADVNVIAKSGFWTDRILNTNGGDDGSARGTNTISGSGTTPVPVRIFLPENATETNRIVYLDFYLGSETSPVQTLTMLQYCPDWVGNYGWEQIDDNESGDFGFNWTRQVYLTYKYSIGAATNWNTNYNYIKSVRRNYGNPFWTNVGYFYNTIRRNNRGYIHLDYSQVNDLSGSTSNSQGLENTIWLYNYGGDAATKAMEEGILSIMKSSGTETAFRIATKADDGDQAPLSTLTAVDANKIAISIALRKNRYNIRQTTAASEGEKGYTPVLAAIEWYLPAVDQFQNLPRLQSITPNEYWSSTTTPGATGDPYDGSGAMQPRSNILKVRACRTRP